ncbi:MAG: hypothetical protein ABII90_08880 [Bacteroidota bacterium]
MNKDKFQLSKWYLDSIDQKGNVFIGYMALLKWKKASIHFCNHLFYDVEKGIKSYISIQKCRFPELINNTLNWKTKHVNASWHGIDKAISEKILESEHGNIEWDCLQPKANSDILLRNDQRHTGLGYTERIDISIKPWEIPINKLYWGRFLSGTDTIIWIDWHGESQKKILYHNGIKKDDLQIFEEKINFEDHEILISQSVILRKGSLISTIFSKFKWFIKVFPSSILNTEECKWRSYGILKKNNIVLSEGWIIHEVVRWG